MFDNMTPQDGKRMGYILGLFAAGGYLSGYFFGTRQADCNCGPTESDSETQASETGVHRGTVVSESFGSEMNQDVSGPKSELGRLNPTVVEGAEDLMGAESFEAQYQNLNPLDYQTPSAFSQVSGYGSQQFWDQANDFLPEYRFPMPWSGNYNPVAPYRDDDYRGFPAGPLPVQTDQRVRPSVQNW